MKTSSSKRFLALIIACLMVVSACLTVTINAAEWDYDDEGTGMPDPSDPNEGLPFDVIDQYYFTYEPSVFGYGSDGDVDMSSAITSAKAGDVIWFKLAVTDIEKELLLKKYDGFCDFEGYYTYDVDAIERYYGGKEVGIGRDYKNETSWLNQFMHLEQSEGMVDISEMNVTINWANVYSSSNPPADWLPDDVNGYGQHFSVMYVGMEYGAGITEDEQFYICVPLKITDDAADGKEFTFTVPYPGVEEFANAFYWDENTGYVVTDQLYGRGGSYTIVIDNHDDVSDNLAADAKYAVAVVGNPLGDLSKGFLNDLRYPLTENSDYTVVDTSINGNAVAYFELSSLSDIDSVVLTFNDTADTDLPSEVEIYGIDADGNSVLLGTVADGVAYDAGIEDSTNYSSTVTVNAANAYQYTLSGIDSGKYKGVYLKMVGTSDTDDSGSVIYSDIAIGEVEIYGEAAKVSVSVVDGTILNASDDGLYLPGTELTIVADDLAHKEFVQWNSENGSGEFDDVSSATTTFIVGDFDEVIYAEFEDVAYELNIVNGIIDDVDQDSSFLTYGESTTITADAPADGTVFDKWVVSDEGSAVIDDVNNPNATVTVYGDATITATYKDCYTLIVNNGEGTDSYVPGGDADVVADEPEEGYVFYKWVVDSGDVEIADEYSASTTVRVNSDAEITATYIEIYKDVPENLVNKNTVVTVVEGTVSDGDIYFTKDQLYPIIADANWLTATDTKSVILSFDLGNVYDITSAAFNFSIPEGYLFTDAIVVYGANNADFSDKVSIGTLFNVNTLTPEEIKFDVDDVATPSNSSRFVMNITNGSGYRYVLVEFSTDYKLTIPGYGTYKNSTIKVGEVEIYGDLTTYDVTVVGGSIIDSSVAPSNNGYYAGTVITIAPDADTDTSAFEKWSASVGAVENNDGTYTYTVNSDVTITGIFTEINQPVPENLVPGATITVQSGTVVNGDAAYLNDQLYPITSGAKWVTYSPENKNISFVVDLGDYYDITSGRFTFRETDGVASILLPGSITIKGSNNADGSDAVTIMSLIDCLNTGYVSHEFVDFSVDSSLDSVSVKYDKEVSVTGAYRYVVISMSTNYNAVVNKYYPNPLVQIGEFEIYGTESRFEVSVENGTIGNASSDGLYDDGDVINLTADEIPHKQFSHWTVEGNGSIGDANSASTTFTVADTDAKIVAVYTDVLYNLVVDNGSGDGEYVYGTNTGIVADVNADPEKVFDKWISDSDNILIADASNPNTTVTVNGDGKVTATYKDRVYLLTVEGGTGSGNYPNGSTVNIVANEPSADMSFDHWEVVTGSCTFADSTSASTFVTTTNEPTTIRPVYVDNLYGVEINNGTIKEDDISEDGYKVGTVITVIADEVPHKEFSHWTVEGNGTFADSNSAETQFTTGSGDMTITAVYTDIKYTLTVVNGTGTGSYVYGASVDVSVIAPEGSKYVFNGWSVVDGNDNVVIADLTKEQTKVTVNGDATISADITLVYSVDVINGKVSDDTSKDVYEEGDVVELVADAPAANKEFAGWVIVSGEGTIDDADSTSTTVTVGSSDLVVRAEYKDILYKITIENGVAEDYSEPGVPAGTKVDIVADPAPEGYEFDKWVVISGNGVISDVSSSTTELEITGSDISIKATYKPKEPTPGTGDGGIAAFALLAVVALAGTMVVAKRKNK